jgi:hypothetical protein
METVKVNGFSYCASCYKEASEQVKGTKGDIEEQGQLAYDFLHYEWNHLNKEGK